MQFVERLLSNILCSSQATQMPSALALSEKESFLANFLRLACNAFLPISPGLAHEGWPDVFPDVQSARDFLEQLWRKGLFIRFDDPVQIWPLPPAEVLFSWPDEPTPKSFSPLSTANKKRRIGCEDVEIYWASRDAARAGFGGHGSMTYPGHPSTFAHDLLTTRFCITAAASNSELVYGPRGNLVWRREALLRPLIPTRLMKLPAMGGHYVHALDSKLPDAAVVDDQGNVRLAVECTGRYTAEQLKAKHESFKTLGWAHIFI